MTTRIQVTPIFSFFDGIALFEQSAYLWADFLLLVCVSGSAIMVASNIAVVLRLLLLPYSAPVAQSARQERRNTAELLGASAPQLLRFFRSFQLRP